MTWKLDPLMLKAVHKAQLWCGYTVEFRIGPLSYGP